MNEDNLIPATEVLRRYSVTSMTLHRWLKNSELAFPEPLYINRRRYFRLGDLVKWERLRAVGRAA